MSPLTSFVAYPSAPDPIRQTIQQAINQLPHSPDAPRMYGWEETDIAGRFIRSEILQRIDESDCFLADVSCLNFNVTYEVGYAIGLGKRLVLTKNRALTPTQPTIQEVGIFDTLGHVVYENSSQLD